MSNWPCLCGREAPCPDHGRFVGQPYRPSYRQKFNGFRLLREVDQADEWGHNTVLHPVVRPSTRSLPRPLTA